MSQATILVVDDEKFFLQLYSELLESSEYRVETAHSGEAAIARIKLGGVDVVMTDMIMPGVDGLEVLRVSRSLDNPPDVIMVTGHATTESAIHALNNQELHHLAFFDGAFLSQYRCCHATAFV